MRVDLMILVMFRVGYSNNKTFLPLNCEVTKVEFAGACFGVSVHVK